MSCGVGCRQGLDPALLWLWCRLGATALVRPLTWESPYAVGAALEKAKRQEKKKLPHDPVIAFLGIYPKELMAGTQTDICTSMLIVVLFTVAER